MTVKIWELSHSIMLFFMMCKEAEKFAFLLLPTFDKKKFYFCYQTRIYFVVMLIVASSSEDSLLSPIWLLISVYECHHSNSHAANVHFNILKWVVTVIWFRHSIDPFWTWETIVIVEVHRNSMLYFLRRERSWTRETCNDNFNSLNRHVIKQL